MGCGHTVSWVCQVTSAKLAGTIVRMRRYWCHMRRAAPVPRNRHRKCVPRSFFPDAAQVAHDLGMDFIAVAAAIALIVGSLFLLPGLSWIPGWFFRLAIARHRVSTTRIPGPRPIPNLVKGHGDALLSDTAHLQLAEWARQYGSIFSLQVANAFAVMVTEPEAVQQVLRKGSPDYMQKPPEMYIGFEAIHSPRRPNIMSAPDTPLWKAVRGSVAPCLSHTNLKKLFPRLQQLAAAAVGVVGAAAQQQREVDVADLAKRVTSDVMGSILLGLDFGGMRMRHELDMEAFNAAIIEAHARMTNPLRPGMVWRQDVRQGAANLAAYNRQLEAKMAAALEAGPPEHTILAALLKVVHPTTQQPLSMAQLKAELGIVLGGGFETTAHAISWVLAALATHPHVQAKLLAELSAAGLTSRKFDWGDLARLPYLNAVIKETLRLFAPATVASVREADKDMTLVGHHVPKGAYIFIPVGAMGLSERLYGPTAATFDPERWMGAAAGGPTMHTADDVADTCAPDQQKRMTQQAAAAAAAMSKCAAPPEPMVFSTGPRDCIGQSLARMELQVVVASLLARFEFKPGAQLAAAVAAAAAKISVADSNGMAGVAAQEGGAVQEGAGKAAAGCCEGGGPAMGLTAAAAAVLQGLYAVAEYHITLQPRGGMMLVAHPRAPPAAG